MTSPRSLSDLVREIAELRAALAPFAAVAEVYEWRPPESLLLSTPLGSIKVGDLSRAAQALER